MESQTKHHHSLRFVLVLLFLGALFISTEKAGQGETARLAAQQIGLHTQERAPVIEEEPLVVIEPQIPIQELIGGEIETASSLHVAMPVPLHGIYLTGWSAGSASTLVRVTKLLDETDINAIVIDIKDATGKLSYQPLDPELLATGVGTNRIKDLNELIRLFHEKGIYVIGRIAVFQDPFYAVLHPEEAFKDTRTREVWRDYKGIAWLRADSRAVWDYTVAIAHDAYAQGFDEINVDYVRYPSDGPLAYLDTAAFTQNRADTIESFFAYISPLIRESGAVLSADLFGLTMSARDDLGIGQTLEKIAPHVDIIAPMVYPSHFAPGAYGIAEPAQYPGEIITQSMSRGIKKLEAVGIDPHKLRPWLQDFNLGAIYTTEMVRAQIDATEALGLSSWMLWDPRNIYTQAALIPPAVIGVQ